MVEVKGIKIVTDSREQQKLWDNTIVKKLDVGDYSLEGFEDKIALERKSGIDLFGSLGKGHKRFRAELERAKSYEYFAIIVEESYTDILRKTFKNAHYSRMKGYVIIDIMHTLNVKYDIPIFFCNGKDEAKKVIKGAFKAYLKTKAE